MFKIASKKYCLCFPLVSLHSSSLSFPPSATTAFAHPRRPTTAFPPFSSAPGGEGTLLVEQYVCPRSTEGFAGAQPGTHQLLPPFSKHCQERGRHISSHLASAEAGDRVWGMLSEWIWANKLLVQFHRFHQFSQGWLWSKETVRVEHLKD